MFRQQGPERSSRPHGGTSAVPWQEVGFLLAKKEALCTLGDKDETSPCPVVIAPHHFPRPAVYKHLVPKGLKRKDPELPFRLALSACHELQL